MSWEAGLPAERGRGSRLGRGAAVSVPLGARAFPAVTPGRGRPVSAYVRGEAGQTDPARRLQGVTATAPSSCCSLAGLPLAEAPTARSAQGRVRPAPASCSFPSSALTLPRKASASLGSLCRVPHCTAAASRRGPSRVTAASPAPRVRDARFRGGAALDHVPAAAGALAGVRELEWETSYIFVSTTFCKG